MKNYSCFVALILLLTSLHSTAQNQVDSTLANSTQLSEVQILSFLSKQSLNSTPASISIIDSSLLQLRVQPTMVSTFNLIPGVRMEERSPGSYRLSIRGSLLRSPFGVRNVKVYLDDFPLTDGGGNTYLNCISLSDYAHVEIIKGPDGSLFGANTGGVVRIMPNLEQKKIAASISGGGNGLFSEGGNISINQGKHIVNVQENFYRCDGYRDNSAIRKASVYLSDTWKYADKGDLSATINYTDLYYQTPGGLTFQQQTENPKSARQTVGNLPSAETQKASVYTKLFFAGIRNKIALTQHLNHTVAIYGSIVNFKNPFITNFETRKEHTEGVRTFLEWHDVKNAESSLHWTLHVGGEWTNTDADIHNYDNIKGEKGPIQTADKIDSKQYFGFSRLRISVAQKLIVETALSLNYAGYHFNITPKRTVKFDPKWMPKFAVSYKLHRSLVIRAAINKGYSTPTTAEIRPANNQLYLALQPESGWNYEGGFRAQFLHERILIDQTFFHYRLQNAIVSNLDNKGDAFFTNAGGTQQTGLETSIKLLLVQHVHGTNFIKSLIAFNNNTWNAFYFHDYEIDNNVFSGNKLTGVPSVINVLGVTCLFQKNYIFSTTFNHTGKLPLNNENTRFASAYNLLQASFGKGFNLKNTVLSVNVGVDNLLNQRYSLGNDINAAGGRYYNPAPSRNIIITAKMTM